LNVISLKSKTDQSLCKMSEMRDRWKFKQRGSVFLILPSASGSRKDSLVRPARSYSHPHHLNTYQTAGFALLCFASWVNVWHSEPSGLRQEVPRQVPRMTGAPWTMWALGLTSTSGISLGKVKNPCKKCPTLTYLFMASAANLLGLVCSLRVPSVGHRGEGPVWDVL
jgi:hypothetical protein